MAFIAGAIIGSTIVGGVIASKGAKSAAKTAAAGQDRSVEFQRESRDIALEHQRPYREAGYTALDALMSMTGLSGQSPRQGNSLGQGDSLGSPPTGIMPEAPFAPRKLGGTRFGGRDSSWAPTRLRAHGGAIHPGTHYNINEIGPENVYLKGRVFRNSNPATIDGETGYVEPNIESRYVGGPMLPGGAIGKMVKPIYGNDQSEGSYSATGIAGPAANVITQNQPIVKNDPLRRNWDKPAYTERDSTGAPIENPGGVEGGFNYQMDPGYNFRFEEGQRALERGAAARGGLLSGGFARKAIRYGQDYASGEYANVYNRIANIAGLGQVANNQSSNAALYAGQGMGQAAANSGYALASGQMASTNAWANTANQLGQLPWGEIFNKPKTPSGPIGRGN